MKKSIYIKAAAVALALSVTAPQAAFGAGPGDGLITIETGQTRYETATPSELPANTGIVRPVEKYSYSDMEQDRKSTRLNSSHTSKSRMPSSA